MTLRHIYYISPGLIRDTAFSALHENDSDWLYFFFGRHAEGLVPISVASYQLCDKFWRTWFSWAVCFATSKLIELLLSGQWYIYINVDRISASDKGINHSILMINIYIINILWCMTVTLNKVLGCFVFGCRLGNISDRKWGQVISVPSLKRINCKLLENPV